jgi:hypothetical protein
MSRIKTFQPSTHLKRRLFFRRMAMAQESKMLITEEGTFDFTAYSWDDRVFSDLLVRENAINSDQAMDISRSLRED